MAKKQAAKAHQQVVWALDPFPESKAPNKNLTNLLGYLAPRIPLKVQPVAVISEAQENLLVNYSKPELWDFQAVATEVLNKQLKNLKIEGLNPPKVIMSKGTSVGDRVKALINYAKRNNGSMIAVSSHSRKGVEKLFLGSFTQRLCQTSKIPLLVVSPKSRFQGKVKKILFPTDFSKDSIARLRSVLKFAKSLSAHVTVVHQFEFPLIPISEANYFIGPYGELSLSKFSKDQKKRFSPKIKTIQSLGAKYGVKCKVVFEDRMQSISQSISDYADEKGMDLIAMPTDAGALSTVVMGSITKQVIRMTDLPVWVVHN